MKLCHYCGRSNNSVTGWVEAIDRVDQLGLAASVSAEGLDQADSITAFNPGNQDDR